MTIRRAGGLVEEALTRSILAAFFEVYNRLGFGFLESVYTEALARELNMLVDGKVVIEVKAGFALPATGSRQLYNYLRATDIEVGLLLHFGPEPTYYREYVPNVRKELPVASAVTALIRDHLQNADLKKEPVQRGL